MSFAQLHPEIWMQILGNLAVGQFKPLSGRTKGELLGEASDFEVTHHAPDHGTIDRADIRSNDLAALMRVSIAFNQIAAPILYRNVICDDLKGLAYFYGKPPAHPLVQSKSDLLAMIRSLALEYRKKSEMPTYADILSRGAYWAAMGETHQQTVAITHAFFEARDMRIALDKLMPKGQGFTAPFPKLAKLSVGAFFGGQARVWALLIEDRALLTSLDSDFDALASAACAPRWPNLDSAVYNDTSSYIDHCRYEALRVFSRSPITHFCQRDNAGPLSWPAVFKWPVTGQPGDARNASYPLETDPVFTLHISPTPEMSYYPAAIGHRTRWVLDTDCRIGPRAVSTSQIVDNFILDRLRPGPMPASGNKQSKRIAIELFASSNYASPPSMAPHIEPLYQDPSAEREMHQMLQELYLQELGLKTWREEIKEWKTSLDSPPCEACGWTFEANEREGEGGAGGV